ncbi:FliM/FliN family flagellar motor switch protein [Rhizobium sp. SL86]|jgi:flagellar motor switch protein FliN/FliY|uniref:FliM/FliN family flagellar motor switch protein n=1 Tax=Rhizobium sp. SL86 TaxID=2995148 RepID=UPI002276B07B|nr:FliM/FliN family flagellar motor switch protein [Rhizobium sp. SL86]MCY1668042.1 FliM/FliN family flagellar motor switch protein [Rhizobium sp. SL86]
MHDQDDETLAGFSSGTRDGHAPAFSADLSTPIREVRMPVETVALRSGEGQGHTGHANPRVNDIPVEIQVVIGRARLSVAQLMNAGPGDCFRLNTRFGEPVELQVNGKSIGYAELVADDFDNLIGVRLVSIAPQV